MLPFLTEEIRKRLVKAKDCARKAADQTDPKLKQDLLKLKEHWLSVAPQLRRAWPVHGTYAFLMRHGQKKINAPTSDKKYLRCRRAQASRKQ
jgi:hypothetical protein